MTYRIHDYNVDDFRDAERLAAMFNDFDSAWPGGFNRGLADTPERIQEDMRRKRRLAILLAECDGEFVGYCDLEAQSGQKEAAYVSLLGARLSHHGKGVGKMLLREMVRRVADLGFKQVTLYTWPGNTKAVPLYKKTGFNWVPETDVFMRNYLPTVLNSPLGKAFFAERDWYNCMQREIEVAPDDVTWKGMKVYPYRFHVGDDFLALTFDAKAHGLTAIETPEYALACYVPAEEVPTGEMVPITWEIVSHDGRRREVTLLTEADPGLSLAVQERFTVDGERTLTRDLRVASDATPRPWGEPAHRVRSTLLIDGQPVVLETGIKVVRPVEIQYAGQALFAGQEQKIEVALQSHLDRALTGQVVLEAHPSLACDQPSCEFTLEPRLRTQCSFRVTAREPGVFTTRMRFNAGETQGERPVSFRALSGVEALGSVDASYDEEAVLESAGLRVETNLRGGHMSLHEPTLNRKLLGHGLAELGPPYVEEPLTEPLYTARVDTTPHGTALVLTAPSTEFPGLIVERCVVLAGAGLARIDYRVYNTTDRPQPAKLLLSTWPDLGGYLAAPTPQGLIREPLSHGGDFPSGDADLLAHGARFTENWIATERDALVCGIIWQGAPEQYYQWGRFPRLRYDLGELPPHSVRSIPSFYMVAGNGRWETVRAWWRRLVEGNTSHEEHSPEPSRVLEVRADPTPVLLTGDREEAAITVFNRRGRPLKGKLTLSGDQFPVENGAFTLEGVDRDHPFTTTVQIGSEEATAAGFLQATVDTGPNVDTFKLPVIRLGAGGAMSISEREAGVFVVENGHLTLRIAPEFLGSIVALECNGVNHLLSAYPQKRPFVWANPWFGGVHPFMGGHAGDDRLTREQFTGQPVERAGERGLCWQGVRTVCEPQHKDQRWLRLEIEYLTLPGSNVVALVSRWTNRNTARTQSSGGMAVWAQVGGTRDNSVSHWEHEGERRQRRRGGFSVDARSSSWVAIENPATSDVLLLILSDRRAHADVDEWGDEGPHPSVSGPIHFEPNETKETLSWLVLCKGLDQIDAYAGLSKVRRLP